MTCPSELNSWPGSTSPSSSARSPLYGATPHVPDIVKRSVECDFLLLTAGPPAFRAVIGQIGFASSFQETHGYYATCGPFSSC